MIDLDKVIAVLRILVAFALGLLTGALVFT